MTVILVLLTFALFVALDLALGRQRAEARPAERASPEPLPATQPLLVPEAAAEPVWVAGYQLPEDLHYHPGHTWVRPLAPDTAAVGLDDFARKLLGPAKGVVLPPLGSRITQGQRAFRVLVDGRAAELLAPVEGEVLEVNRRLDQRPALATDEPYGRGWLVKVRSRELGRSLRNLLKGTLARRWMEDARERLDLELVALSGSVLQDGGEPVSDFARHLPEDDWRRLVGEFLLT